MASSLRLKNRRGDSGNSDPTPLYYRLETILRAAIASGEHPAGKCLPAEPELGRLYGVSRITVRRALESLVNDGLLVRKRGRAGGTFVGEQGRRPGAAIGPLDRVPTTRPIDSIRVLAFDLRPCDVKTATLLGLEAHETIRYIERVMNTQDGPLGYVRNYLPASIGKQVRRKDLDHRFLKHVLSETYGVKILKVRDEVEAHLADSRIAALLKIRTGSPILRIIRQFFGPKERCVCLTDLLMSSNYRMAVTLPEEVMAQRD
jgi:GntR family transcriptional regulator